MRPSRSDEELKKIAQELVTNQIFMSDQLRNPRDINLVFMTLFFLSQEQIDEMKENKTVHLYAYLKNRQSRSVNGNPIFYEHYELNQEEYDKIRKYEEAMRKAMEAVK